MANGADMTSSDQRLEEIRRRIAIVATWGDLASAASAFWGWGQGGDCTSAALADLAIEIREAVLRCFLTGASVDAGALFMLASSMDRLGMTVPPSETWTIVASATVARAKETMLGAQGNQIETLAIIVLALWGLNDGLLHALRSWIGFVANGGPAEAEWRGGISRMLHSTGWLGEGRTVDKLVQDVQLPAADQYASFLSVSRALDALGFHSGMAPGWLAAVFEGAVLPWMGKLAEAAHLDVALYLEMRSQCWVTSSETEEHYNAVLPRWEPCMRAAGRRMAAALPAFVERPPGPRPLVGVFVHMASMLAHITMLHAHLQGALGTPGLAKRLDFRLYVFGGYNAVMEESFTAIGVPIVWWERENPEGSTVSRLLALRQRLIDDQVAALVWLCAPFMLSLAFGLRMGPRQIWLSVKFHPDIAQDADGRIAYTTEDVPTVSHFGREWRAVRGSFPSSVDLGQVETAQEIRRTVFGRFDVILGVIGREAKLRDPAYLSAISLLLRRNPTACFFYTGSSNPAAIVKAFTDAGVVDRTMFVGWVDPLLYAHVADIYVDSWPLSSGLTAAQAMGAGKPYVFQDGPGSIMRNWALEPWRTGSPADAGQFVRTTFAMDGERKLLNYGGTTDEYIAAVQRLIDDHQLRADSGDAHRKFYEQWLQDTSLSGRRLIERLCEIIAAPRRILKG